MKALRDYLERTGTTQAALARQIGVSQPTIANLVNNVHSASAGVLKRLAHATGLSVDELLSDESVPSGPASFREHIR